MMRITFGKFMLAAALLCSWAVPAAAEDSAQEAANKQVVLAFYDALNDADDAGAMSQRIAGIAETYLHPDYHQHAEMYRNLPGGGSDRDKLVRMFQSMPAMPAGVRPRPATIAIMAEGDLVMMLTRREMPNPATGQVSSTLIFNMFRVDDGKLIEHWDTNAAPSGGPPPGAGGMPPGGPPGPPPGSAGAPPGSQ